MEGVDFVLEDTSIIALTHIVPYTSYMIKISLWDIADAFASYWDRFREDIIVLYLYYCTCTCEASWLSGTVRDLQARGRQFDPRLR